MSEQPQSVVAEAYLVIEPQWRTGSAYWARDKEGHPILTGAKITRVTQTRPNVTKGGVVTKVKFRIPAGVMLPLRPEVVIDLNLDNAEVIEVEATNPKEDSDG